MPACYRLASVFSPGTVFRFKLPPGNLSLHQPLKTLIKYLVLSLCLLPFTGNSQMKKVHFARLSEADGLPQSHVFAIGQDAAGMVWLGTMGGVARYDGLRFINYFHQADDSTSLTASHAYCFLALPESGMWVGTTAGLNRYDAEKDAFVRYPHVPGNPQSPGHPQIRGLAQHPDGRITVLHGRGVDLFDPEKGTFSHYLHPSFGYGRHTPCMAQGRDGTVWAGSVNGLYRWTSGDTGLTWFPLNLPDGTPVEIREVYEDSESNLWLGTHNGLYLFHPDSETYEQIETGIPVQELHIQAIEEHPRGMLYLGTGQGLYRFHIRSRKVVDAYVYARDNPEGIAGDVVYSLMKDRSDNLWIGLFNGLNIINPEAEKFDLYYSETGLENLANTILQIKSDSKGRYWVNAMTGLHVRDSLAAAPQWLGLPPDNEPRYRPIRSMVEDAEGEMWFAVSGEGLFRTVNQQPTRIRRVESQLHFRNRNLWWMVFDRESPDYLWLGTTGGLCHYHIPSGDTSWVFPKDAGQPGNGIGPLAQDEFGILWFTNSGNLCSYHPRTGEWWIGKKESGDPEGWYSRGTYNLLLQGNRIYLSGSSFSYFDKSTKNFRNFHSGNSILTTGVTSVQAAPNGKIWMAGGNTLYEYSPETDEIRRFGTERQTGGFITGSGNMDRMGQIQFGSYKGILDVNPAQIRADSAVPPIVLSRISVLNQPVAFDAAIYEIKSLELQPDESVFTLEFSGLSYMFPENLSYYYQLKGFDKQRVEAGNRREVTYTNLSPGTYTFVAGAVNADGFQSANEIQLEIRVLPGFWQTWWFRGSVIALLLLVGGIISANRIRTRKLRAEKQLAERSAQYKSRFLANMSHEIRTPMNAIIGLNQLLMTSRLDEKQRQYVEAIHLSCENLLWIINDILDQAKIESGKLSIQSVPMDIRKVVAQVVTLLEHKMSEKQLDFRLEISEQVPQTVMGDPTRLYQILVNLVGNAIKFTRQGYISIRIIPDQMEKRSGVLRFEVEDSGVGIPPEKQQQVFASFEQDIPADSSEAFGNLGTGLGLSITRELVQLQGGDIHLHSEVGKGSVFSFTLPFTLPDDLPDQISSTPSAVFPKNLRILIVEDTPLNQFLARELLEKHLPQPELTVVSNGEEALRCLETTTFDLVLMDVKMPVKDGLTATREFRGGTSADATTLPILGLTANAIPEQIEACRTAGMNDVVCKPIQVEELLEKMNGVLKR